VANKGNKYVAVTMCIRRWLSERGAGGLDPLDFENFRKKVVCSMARGKNQISPLLTPLEKIWKNPLVALPGKNPFDAHAEE